MPKKIPDLEAKILRQAGILFLTKGYAEVDMKTIAHEVGTSVGNLYNYFPSKTALFLAGSASWWQTLECEFKNRTEGIVDPLQRIQGLLFELLESLESRIGLWEEFLAASSREMSRDEVKQLQERMRQGFHLLVERVDDLLNDLGKSSPRLAQLQKAPGFRTASALVSTVKMLARMYSGQGEENKRFITQVLDSFLQ